VSAAAIHTRRMRPEDLRLVIDSWLDSYRMSHMAGPIPMSMYDDVYRRVLRELVQRPDIVVIVAYEPGEEPPNDIYGWICVERDAWTRANVRENGLWVEKDVRLEQPLVHYVNVKQAFRGHGVARALFAAAGVDPERRWTHTFSTAVVVKMRGRHRDGTERLYWRGHFDPRLARFPKKQLPKTEPTEE